MMKECNFKLYVESPSLFLTWPKPDSDFPVQLSQHSNREGPGLIRTEFDADWINLFV